MPITKKHFMKIKKIFALFLSVFLLHATGFSENASLNNQKYLNSLNIDHQKLVSRADLIYEKPVVRSEAGMPLGNGRMGSLIWTSPSSLKMQINRVDVFAVNNSTNSFPQRHTDYASGCGYVDIHMVNFGEDVFTEKNFRQHLKLYDGLMTLYGNNISAQMFAWHEQDVIAIEIEDQRESAIPINIDLRMLRYLRQYYPEQNYELASHHAVKVRTRAHTATSQLHIRNRRIILTQKFRENDFYNASSVAISILGRKSIARYLNESTVQLTASPENGTFTVFIASASSSDPTQDMVQLALDKLDSAEKKGFHRLMTSNKRWWHDFWSKSYVHLHSKDGVADYVEQNYTYFQYVMASSSQGDYQPRYGGMLWYTTGDMREWGSQYWWNNQSCYYNALPPTNRFELMDPLFFMFSHWIDSYALAARQQWGSKGIWIPETTWFDGLEKLPEDIASEMQALYLLKKPWEKRSDRFRRYAESKLKHNSRWNWATVGRWDQGHWIIPEKGVGPFGHVTHIFSTTAQIAYLYWLRYEYTQDKTWLKEYAYPMIKGAVEFYRHFPDLRKESDGKYHIYHTNNNEGIWDGHNTLMDISAIQGMTPILIRASEILDKDADMRPVWKEFSDNISPLPTTEVLSSKQANQSRYWISSVPPAGHGDPERPGLVIYYDLCTAGTEDTEMVRSGNASFDAIYKQGIDSNTSVHVLNKNPVGAAYLGRSEALKYMIPNQIRCDLTPEKDFCDWIGVGKVGVLPNRMTLREGPGAIGCQRLGNASTALHKALLQSVPPAPGKDPVIYLFPAWPAEWDAAFTLLARGAFLVTASIKNGKIGLVEIESKMGGQCRIKNPWPGEILTMHRNHQKSENISGALLIFDTNKDEIVSIMPKGSTPTEQVVPFKNLN